MRVTSRNVRAFAVAVAMLGTATAESWAQIQIVLVHQPPNRIAGWFSDMDCDFCGAPMILAEDFVLSEDQTITAFALWGAYFPTSTPVVDSFSVKIYEDAAGIPGAMVYSNSVSIADTEREETGQHIAVLVEYKYVLTLSPPRFLVAGTYFVEILNNTFGSTESFLWECGGIDPEFGLDGAAVATTARSTRNWARQPGMNMAFEVLVQPGDCVCGDIDYSGGAIDLNDFGVFATCFGLVGPAGDCDAAAFACSDMDASGAVDLDDFASFALLFATTPTNFVPNCTEVED